MRKNVFLIFLFLISTTLIFSEGNLKYGLSFPYFNEIFYSQYRFHEPFALSKEIFPEKKILNLNECVKLAIYNNLDLKISRLEIKKSISDYFGSYAVFEPFVDNKVYYKRNVTPSPSVFQGVGSSKTKETYYSSTLFKKFSPGTTLNFTFESKKLETNNIFFLINPAYNTTLSLSITQPLLKGFGCDVNKEMVDISLNNVRISKGLYKDKVENIIFEVSSRFIDILIAQKNVSLLKKRVALARRTLYDVRNQVKAGVRPKVDEKKAEAELYRQEENLLEAENNLKDLKAAFLAILFSTEDTEKYVDYFELKDSKINLKLYDFKSARQIAFSERGDLKAAIYKTDNGKIDLKVKKKNLKPQLDLTLGYFQYGLKGSVPDLSHFPFHIDPNTQQVLEENYSGGVYDSISNAFHGKYNGILLQFDFKIPLGNRDAKSKAVSAYIDYEKNLCELKKIKQKINLDLRNVLRDVEKSKKRIEVARKEVAAAKGELEGEELKFKYKVSTLRDLLDAQNKFIEAKLNYFSSKKEFEKNLLKLHRVTSDLHKEFGIKFFKP